jgi:hypothetical protein
MLKAVMDPYLMDNSPAPEAEEEVSSAVMMEEDEDLPAQVVKSEDALDSNTDLDDLVDHP